MEEVKWRRSRRPAQTTCAALTRSIIRARRMHTQQAHAAEAATGALCVTANPQR